MKTINKKSVTELKSLCTPPRGVVSTLGATLLLLNKGENCHVCPTFKDIKKALADSATMLDKSATLDPKDVPLEVALGALCLLQDITKESIEKTSKAASDFYEWNISVIEAVLERFGKEEISKTQPCVTPQFVK